MIHRKQLVAWFFMAIVAAVSAMPMAANELVQPEQRGVLSTSEALEAISRGIRDDARLHGASLVQTLDVNTNELVIHLIVDPAGSPEQESLMRALLRKTPFDRRHRIAGIIKLPLTELIAELNLAIESKRILDGCFVQGAYYEINPTGGQKLQLYGRIRERAQIIEIADACGKLMSPDSEYKGWRFAMQVAAQQTRDLAAVVPDAKGKQLEELEPLALNGQMLFAAGLEYYDRGDFAAATTAFERAIIESPDRMAYRYWRIASLINQGERSFAYRNMMALSRRGSRSPMEFRSVMRSLERVQGPTRHVMSKMETFAAGRYPYELISGKL